MLGRYSKFQACLRLINQQAHLERIRRHLNEGKLPLDLRLIHAKCGDCSEVYLQRRLMMHGRFWKYPLIFLGLILIGCGGGASSEPTPTPDAAAAMQAAIQATIAAEQGNRGEQLATWLEELDAAEMLWQEQEIDNYEIVVVYTPSHTVNQSLYTLTVENGEIV